MPPLRDVYVGQGMGRERWLDDRGEEGWGREGRDGGMGGREDIYIYIYYIFIYHIFGVEGLGGPQDFASWSTHHPFHTQGLHNISHPGLVPAGRETGEGTGLDCPEPLK